MIVGSQGLSILSSESRIHLCLRKYSALIQALMDPFQKELCIGYNL
jgi:hypothetical protein